MNTVRRIPLVLSVLGFTACSSGGGGNANPPAASPANAVHVVLDTAGGHDALVQARVTGATLQRADGSRTGNLLPTPRTITLNDPSGEAESLDLRGTPAGGFVALHLLLAPGSAAALLPDGSTVPVDLPGTDLTIVFEDDFTTTGASDDWLAVRHGGVRSLAGGNPLSWSPSLIGGPPRGAALGASTLTVSATGQNGFDATIAGDDRGRLHVGFENGTELYDDHGNRVLSTSVWLGANGTGREISVLGALDDDGGVHGRRMRSSGNGDNPRLIGRIESIDAVTTSFVMRVHAEALRGNRRMLPAAEHVTVAATGAQFHFSHTFTNLTFGDLHVGDLVKVAWITRVANNATAREVEVVSRLGAPFGPESEGMVSSVNLLNRTITIVPRHNDPLIVGGQSVTSAVLTLQDHTILFRKANSGGGRTVIQLAEVVPASDRIWFRGVPTGPGALTADWIRVRQD